MAEEHCPKCKSADVLPIVYGFPLPAGPLDENDTRRYAGGGCSIDASSRQWQCMSCGVTFNDGGTDVLEAVDYRPQWVRDLADSDR